MRLHTYISGSGGEQGAVYQYITLTPIRNVTNLPFSL